MNKSKMLEKSKSVALKIGRFVASRVFYLALGIFLATGMMAMAATWPNAKVGAGTQLTKAIWDNMIGYLEAMDTKVDNINSNINNKPGAWTCTLRTGSRGGSSTADCLPNEKVITGGCDKYTSDFSVMVYTSAPGVNAGNNGGAWFCNIQTPHEVRARAYCCI